VIGGKVSVDTSGFKFLVAENKKRDVTLKGARAGGKVLERAAKAAAPVRKGSRMLRKAQGVKAAKGRKGSTLAFAVQGARKRVEATITLPGRKKPERLVPAFYDHVVMGGTAPHSVSKGQRLEQKQKVNKKGRLYGKAIAQTDQTGRQHPGARANPYRKRAWESAKSEAGKAALAAMAKEEQRLIAKAAKNG
jgi:hypothetical protein